MVDELKKPKLHFLRAKALYFLKEFHIAIIDLQKAKEIVEDILKKD